MVANIKRCVKKLRSILYHPILHCKIKAGKGCIIGRGGSYLNPREVTLGDRVSIGNDVRISCYRTYYENQKLSPKLQIGNNVTMCNRCSILCADTITIKDRVLIASDVLITSEDHGIEVETDVIYGNQKLSHEPVAIEEEVWIGEKVIILKGVTIGKRSIIGAGSVVTKSIPPYCIAVGNPVRVIKKYNFDTHSWDRWKDE